ncbi:MAG: transcriptional regulator [Bacteroidales bacterium]|nr:MAG: transcriptional regulator [Bacteroidales bacterium]
MMTIDTFNRLTGQETLHPLVGIADLTADSLDHDIDSPCNFYALLCNGERLRLIIPGEIFRIPAAVHKRECGYTGVLFHPDLLCDTPLERDINKYPCRCTCHKPLCDSDKNAISGCISLIAHELEHSIDRYSSTIIVSQIGLLLNYCTRICCN